MSKREKILVGIIIVFILVLFVASISLFESPTVLKEKITEPLKETVEEKKSLENIKEKTAKNTAFLYVEETKYESEIKREETIYTFMVSLRESGKLNFREKNYSGLGKFIEEINGIRGKDGKYWIYYVNGKRGEIGVSKYKLNPGDVVSWRYENYLQS